MKEPLCRESARDKPKGNLAMQHSSLYILIYQLLLCLIINAKPSDAIKSFTSALGEFDCDFNPINHGRIRVLPPRRGDNGFSVKLEGQPEFYQPEKTYTVTLRSTHPVTFRGFVLSAKQVGNGSSPAGSFKILNVWTTRPMNHPCSHAVTHATKGKKSSAQFVWTAPPAGFGCVQIRASVIQKGTIWFRDDGDLTQEICEAPAETVSDDRVECCACGSASYRMTFYGLWSPQTHPKNYPTYSTHWSNVIGASHNERYTIWDYGDYASDGVKKVAEWGWPNAVEDEIRGQGDSVLSVIKTRAQWPAYKPRNIREPPSSVFTVDAGRHLVSLLSMLGPSPDWNVGITQESMCTEQCGWEAEKVYDLTPWDAGTDSGVSYMSINSPTRPQDKIRALTSLDDPESPFYDPAGGPIPPVARVVLSRLSIVGEQCGTSPPSNEGSSDPIDTALPAVAEASSNQQSSCVYSEWSDWSACEVTCGWGIKVRSKMLKAKLVPSATCESPLMEKEICRGSEQCENEDQSTVCLYSDWTDWSQCTETCGKDALRFRTRTLKWPSEETNCHEPLKEMKFDCYTGPCSTDLEECHYDEWSDWMPCSAQCGVGQTLRKRFARGQNHCESPNMETSKCMASVDCSLPVGFDVPQGCVYSPWTGWMPCPVTCGVGQTFRKRVLDSSRPDVNCENVQMETSKCMTSESCSEVLSRGGAATDVCRYSDWTDWMPCSQSCDVGKTLRKRFLTDSPRGTCNEIKMETVLCYMPPCSAMTTSNGRSILDGNDKRCIYGAWTAWMPCSVTCGKGETLRKRFLVKSLDISRICEGFEMETNRCTVPVSCQVEEETGGHEAAAIDEGRWSEWSACSVTCGQGMKSRTQTISDCHSASPDECTYSETEECVSRARCPIDCVLGEWSDWSRCPPCKSTINRRHLTARRAKLPTAQQTRTRRRLAKPRYGGRRCGPRRERRKCFCE